MAHFYTIWIEERDKAVWHGIVRRKSGLIYEAGCGWELSARAGRIWPLKHDDPGPPTDERCHSCMNAQ